MNLFRADKIDAAKAWRRSAILKLRPRQAVARRENNMLKTKHFTVSLLLAGGLVSGQADTWATKTPMPTARSGSVSGVIDGQVYVVNGNSVNGISLGANEVYDPVADRWAIRSPNPTPSPYAAGGVINRKLYIAGGCGPANDCRVDTVNILEVYDPATDSWATGAPMPTARSGAAAGVINGELYVAGGQLQCPPCVQVPNLEVYNPASNSWATKRSMPLAVGNGPAAAVINGQLFVVGGYTNSGTRTGAVQAYDPTTDTWTAKASMPTPRSFLSAGLIDGILYAVGGNGTSGSVVGTNESYTPTADTWQTSPPMPTARTYATGSVVNNNLYVVGGVGNDNVIVGTNEAFDPLSLGIDISRSAGDLPRPFWDQAKTNEQGFVIVDTWMGQSQNHFAVDQLGGASLAGLKTAAYMELNLGQHYINQPGAVQVQKALDTLSGFPSCQQTHAGEPCIAFLAIAIEPIGECERHVPVCYPPAQLGRRQQLISEAVQAVHFAGFKPIIYTTKNFWNNLAGNSNAFSSFGLWDDSDLENVIPDLSQNCVVDPLTGKPRCDAFVGYGSWTSRVGQQYKKDTTLPGSTIPIDLDIFATSLFH